MTGIERIAKERKRQIEEEGWSAEHDDKHVNGEMASVATCYIHFASYRGQRIWQEGLPGLWPLTWLSKWWKPEPRGDSHPCPIIRDKDAIRMLEKAGALIAAEIDRIQRGEEA